MATAAEIFADALRYWMTKRGMKQTALAAKSGIGQTTISLYLRPGARETTARGTTGSPTLANIEALAIALDVEVADLLRPGTEAERDLIQSVRALVAEKATAAASPGKEQTAA